MTKRLPEFPFYAFGSLFATTYILWAQRYKNGRRHLWSARTAALFDALAHINKQTFSAPPGRSPARIPQGYPFFPNRIDSKSPVIFRTFPAITPSCIFLPLTVSKD